MSAGRSLALGAAALLLVALAGCPDRKRAGTPTRADADKPAPPRVPAEGPLAQKVLYEQAKSLLRAGKPSEALKAFKRALAAAPRGKLEANCYLGMGSAHGELGQFDKAVRAYEKVVELRPRDPEAYHALAIGQEDAGDLRGARASLTQALALNPDQLAAYQDLASLYLKDKDLEGAKKVYLQYELRRTYLIKTLGMAKKAEDRAAAAAALGQARDEATAKALGLALTDRSREVRIEVIKALGRQALAEGAGPLRAHLRRTKDDQERRLTQIALKAIAAAPQPGPQSAPAVRADDAPPASRPASGRGAVRPQPGDTPPSSR